VPFWCWLRGQAVATRLGIGFDEVEHRFGCALHYLQLVGRDEMSVADAQAAVPRTESDISPLIGCDPPNALKSFAMATFRS